MTGDHEDRQAHQLADRERRDERDRWSDDAINREPILGKRGRRRLLWIALAAVLLALLATLPPLLNISRYQHRITTAIAESIGRPVRFDRIELHLLPLPGFTIHNFVVMEDGAFGAEPAMRANVVEARIRFGSLWRRRVEISRIRLQSPTVNLVRNDAGYWNLQGVVTQAAHVQSAPTAQAKAGDAPRFPYIEATDARLNLKLGETKLPYALTDAEFALWLPNEQEWRLRLAGRPLRTDTDASDVGEVRLEATLGRKGSTAAQQPFNLEVNWKPTPLGEASKLAMGHDTGWRGNVFAEMEVQGTPAAMRVTTDMHVRDLRRAEFVPAETLQLDVHCEAQAVGVVHQLSGVRCALPTAKHGSLLDGLPFFKAAATTAAAPVPDILTLKAEVPSITDLRSATARVELEKASPEWALRWMRLFSSRMLPSHTAAGSFGLLFQWDATPGKEGWNGTVACHCILPDAPGMPADRSRQAESETSGPAATGSPDPKVDAAGADAILSNVWLFQAAYGGAPHSVPRTAKFRRAAPGVSPAADSLFAVTAFQQSADSENETVSSAMPGSPAISGTVGLAGATLHYQTAAIARRLATLVPALGDNLPGTLTGPAVSERAWGTTQVWTAANLNPATARRHRGRRRR